MNVRKEKEKEFFIHHMDTFKAIGNQDPLFIIKTAFFQKGKYGRFLQFFESEIGKGEDIYIEFCDNVNNANGELVNIVPFSDDRQLFKYKYNPFYTEEYETKNGTNFKGDPYVLYTVPISEMIAVLKDATEITHALYEKRKTETTINLKKEELELPKLQSSLFPNFEEAFVSDKEEMKLDVASEDCPLSEMTVKDLAAIMLMKPVSDKSWLNIIIKTVKDEL